MLIRIAAVITLLLTMSFSVIAEPDEQCQSLVTLKLKQAQVQSAQITHQRCEVKVRVWPAQSSSKEVFIDVSVWMPIPAYWNHRFLGLGNGGYSPRLPDEAMSNKVKEGFAVAASDTGHQSESLDFAVDAPERIDFWGRSSVHTMNQYAMKLINAYYHQDPEYKYYAGCSTGGHQGLASAQFYPDDFDGIIAGAPGHNRVALNAAFLWLYQQSHSEETGLPVLTREDLAQYHQMLLNSCDDLDGSNDSIIGNPGHCEPDYGAFTCSDETQQSCLSADKISRLRNIHRGPFDPVTKEQIYPGFPIGSEFTGGVGWSAYWHDPTDSTKPARSDFWRLWVFDQEQWDPWTFDWHKDYQFAVKQLSHRIDATETDLTPFFQQGSKLLLFHGMADPIVSYPDTVDYFEKVLNVSAWENKPDSSPVSLFLIPGMSHCAGGDGLNAFDPLPALQSWVEKGTAPTQINAERIENDDISIVQPIQPYNK